MQTDDQGNLPRVPAVLTAVSPQAAKAAAAVAPVAAAQQAAKDGGATKPGGRSLDERSLKEYVLVMAGGMAFSFNAGYINGACLNAFGEPDGVRQSVAGLTGVYTRAALHAANGNGHDAGTQIAMILCMLGGSMIVGALTPKRKPWRLAPEFGPAFLIGAFFLAMSTVFAHEEGDNGRGVFYWAAAANGLQNGMTSLYSGNLIRTTHLTGTTTDMGLFCGQLLRGYKVNAWRLRVLVLLAISFFMGSFTSFWATKWKGKQALIANAALFTFVGIVYIGYIAKKRGISYWKATTGRWDRSDVVNALTEHYGNKVEELFDVIDANDSGKIEPEELLAAIFLSGHKVSRRTLRQLVRDADEDGDGLISREDFYAVMGMHLGASDHPIDDEEGVAELAAECEIARRRSKAAGSARGSAPLLDRRSSRVSGTDSLGYVRSSEC